MSGRNTKIAKSKSGYPRFPFENAGVGDGYALSGPVTTYKLSPEELARYGPPTKRKDRNLSQGEVLFVIKSAKNLEHAAIIARVNTDRLRHEMKRHCIAVPKNWREAEKVEDTQVYDIVVENKTVESCDDTAEATQVATTEKQPEPAKETSIEGPESEPANKGEMEVYTPPQTRLDVLRSKITKEQYLTWKKEGLSDRAILQKIDIVGSIDTLTKLKNEWGIKGMALKSGPRSTSASENKKSLGPAPAATREKNKQARDALQVELEEVAELAKSKAKVWMNVLMPRPVLVYLAAQILANIQNNNDRGKTRYQYIKEKLGWDSDFFKHSAHHSLVSEWDAFRGLMESLTEQQLWEIIFEWPAVAEGLTGIRKWILDQVFAEPEILDPDLDPDPKIKSLVFSTEPTAAAYIHDGKEIFVSAGLNLNQFGTFWRSNSGGLHRVQAPAMPMVGTAEEAQRNLDDWAEKKGLSTAVTAT